MKLALVGMAREESSRLTLKMIRPFSDTTLYDIYLKKMNDISKIKNPFDEIVMGISKNDKIIWEKSKGSDIRIIDRSKESIERGYIEMIKTIEFIKECKSDYIFVINGCFPFLKIDTIIKIATFFKENKYKSLICVKERRNHFFDSITHLPIINKDVTCYNTITLPPLLESINNIVVFNKDYFFKTKSYWDNTKNNPYLYVLDYNEECLDVDIPLEFDICESIYKRKTN